MPNTIKTGDRIVVKDKLDNESIYIFQGIRPEDNGREVILYNIDLDEETCVEFEWFRQRKLEVYCECI